MTQVAHNTACAISLGHEFVRAISKSLPPVIDAAKQGDQAPHVILGGIELAVAELVRQTACSFVPGGSEEAMAKDILRVVEAQVTKTDWPDYREHFEKASIAPPAKVAQ